MTTSSANALAPIAARAAEAELVRREADFLIRHIGEGDGEVDAVGPLRPFPEKKKQRERVRDCHALRSDTVKIPGAFALTNVAL